MYITCVTHIVFLLDSVALNHISQWFTDSSRHKSDPSSYSPSSMEQRDSMITLKQVILNKIAAFHAHLMNTPLQDPSAPYVHLFSKFSSSSARDFC